MPAITSHSVTVPHFSNQKHFVKEGPFAGLWVRTARALEKAGYTDKAQLAGVLSDKYLLFRNRSPLLKDFGKIANEELVAWLQAHENSVAQPSPNAADPTVSVVRSSPK